MRPKPEPIHKWDRAVVLKALLYGAVLEAFAIAPALLSTWGHAGPTSPLGWLSALLNLPGMYVVRVLGAGILAGDSVVTLVLMVYLIQTIAIGYVAFIWMRWRKRRAQST